MRFSLPSLLLFSGIVLAAPAPAPIEPADAANAEKRAVHRFHWTSQCHEKPNGKWVATFPAGSSIDVSCYHWHNGNPSDLWYFTMYGCWIHNRDYAVAPGDVIPNLPPC